MANTTSGTNVFEKTFYIDEIIEESYNRIGQFDMSGYKNCSKIFKYFIF